MLLSIKIELIPNNKYVTAFRKTSFVARHADNWANGLIKNVLL
ncbi:MAG: helix-turn-helix domain-containing protein [Microcoleaceae cyanobacterium]